MKKKNLGRTDVQYLNFDELTKSIYEEARCFNDELKAITDQFDLNNAYDKCVLITLFAHALANAVAASERVEGEVDNYVIPLYNVVLNNYRRMKREGTYWVDE